MSYVVDDWDNDKPELNITPLVDIMLVLLAILMITTPTLTYHESIELPKSSKNTNTPKNKILEIRMDIKGNIYINKDTYQIASFPKAFLQIATQYPKNTPIYIRADKRLIYDHIIFLLKNVREAGFHKVSLVTSAWWKTKFSLWDRDFWHAQPMRSY